MTNLLKKIPAFPGEKRFWAWWEKRHPHRKQRRFWQKFGGRGVHPVHNYPSYPSKLENEARGYDYLTRAVASGGVTLHEARDMMDQDYASTEFEPGHHLNPIECVELPYPSEGMTTMQDGTPIFMIGGMWHKIIPRSSETRDAFGRVDYHRRVRAAMGEPWPPVERDIDHEREGDRFFR